MTDPAAGSSMSGRFDARLAGRPMGQPAGRQEGALREKVYRIARVLSIILVADGLFMAWAVAKGTDAFLGYGKLSFLPLFIPAFLVSVVVSAIYVHGFARQSWTIRKSEVLFFALLFLTVVAKFTLFLE